MSDLPEMKKEPNPENTSINAKKNLMYPIIAGAIGGFLLPFFFIAIPYWVGNSDVSPIEALFLDLPIFVAFSGKASILFFILLRALAGGVFGYWAYLLLRRKKLSVVLIGAFLAGSFIGVVLLIFGMVFSMQ
jgi:hypothetical protein